MAAAYRKLAIRSKDRGAWASLYEGLEGATDYGTARQARPPGVSVAGKTGTASELGSGAVHAWFAGYAPADTPRIVVVVFLEQGIGGRDAAPIARELFQVALHTP
jgi:cell division protein FtsI/penicillin-binding protein 2